MKLFILFIAFVSIFSACKKSSVSPQGSGASTSTAIDLSLTDNAALKTIGGFVYVDQYIVARVNTTTYTAFSRACTNDGCDVRYSQIQNYMVCPCHAGSFDSNGNPTTAIQIYPLRKYNTSLSGNTLTINN
jgi:cytochrome b6-f complex iron-sulfur subunit